MREIIFDTETTGLDSRDDRIIEIGAVELLNRFPTGRSFHVYINPESRDIHPEAQAVHGISKADLADKPAFAAIVGDFLAFVEEAKLVAHNANFDMAFLNAELARLGLPHLEQHRIVDTLAIAKRKHPMGPNSLDALCRRYGIDNSRRSKHGALLDSELLSEVYIELIGGKQAALGLAVIEKALETPSGGSAVIAVVTVRARPLAARLSEIDLAAHAALVAEIGGHALWNRIAPPPAAQASSDGS